MEAIEEPVSSLGECGSADPYHATTEDTEESLSPQEEGASAEPSSHEQGGSAESTPGSTEAAGKDDISEKAAGGTSEGDVGLQDPEDYIAGRGPPSAPATSALSLIEQLKQRQLAREGKEWDVEDEDVDAMQLDDVAVRIYRSPSDATDESSSAVSAYVCPITRAESSLDFEKAFHVPYQAQYRRVVEDEDDAEMQRLLCQLEEEQRAVRELAAAQRYQLMQEQLVVIQKQLGNGNAKIPDLDWLLANDPENNQELEEVIAAFAARDDDLPQDAPQAPELPLTCKNFFCRCPWSGDMQKDERASAGTSDTLS